jgi:hypothetical protein
MNQENKTWESVKQAYLKQVEAAIKAAGHSKPKEILDDVSAHLDQKFADLNPDNYSWENFQKIIIEMGPPSDYAELLGPEIVADGKKKRRNRLLAASLAVIFLVLVVWLSISFYTAPVTQDYFHKHFSENIAKLNIDTAKPAAVTAIFGEPRQYIWGQQTFHKWNLPIRYIMVYPDDFRVFISEDRIVEVRYEGPGTGYVWKDKLRVGSSLDDVISAIGEPNEIVEGNKNFFEDGVLYKDIEGRKGYCYYGRQSQRIRMFFTKYKIIALYVTRSDYKDR